MDRLDEAIEAGALAIHASHCCPLDPDSQCDLEDLFSERDQARLAILAGYPILVDGTRSHDVVG